MSKSEGLLAHLKKLAENGGLGDYLHIDEIEEAVLGVAQQIQDEIEHWEHQRTLMNTHQGQSCCEVFVTRLKKLKALLGEAPTKEEPCLEELEEQRHDDEYKEKVGGAKSPSERPSLLAHLNKQAEKLRSYTEVGEKITDSLDRKEWGLGYKAGYVSGVTQFEKLSKEAVLGVAQQIQERIFVMENKMKPKWNEIQQLKWVLALLGAKEKEK